ncbi:MAG: right-handed parallel beta-helix repeat-containing protein [Chloroflexota bacterium]|nr:right-handed parallel beta-helix repeat-containing protein [Chloroflexota bacterium]
MSLTAFSIESEEGYFIVLGRQDGVCGDAPDVDGYTCDSERVQAAVDNNPGGKILLKGEFHFAEIDPDTGYIVPGTDQFVDIQNDIEIRGQKVWHKYKTKIVGGWDTFRSGVMWMDITPWGIPTEWFFPNEDSPHQIAIRDIHFDQPFFTAIHLLKFDGAYIIGNKFTGGRAFEGFRFLLEGLPFPLAWHMKIGVYNPLDFLIPADPSEAMGEVLIDRNIFDGQYYDADPGDPWAYEMWDGTFHTGGTLSFVVWMADVEVTVTTNLFDQLSGLHHGAFEVNAVEGDIVIKKNVIKRPNGGGGIFLSSGSDFGGYACKFGDIYVENNIIELNAVNEPDPVYKFPFSGIDLGGSMCGNLQRAEIKNNIISGVVQYGIWANNITDSTIINNLIDIRSVEGKDIMGILGGAITDSKIKNNIISINGTPASNSGRGIKLEGGVTDYDDTGELINPIGSSRNTIKYNLISGVGDFAISIGDSEDSFYGSSDENVIVYNMLKFFELQPGSLGVAGHVLFTEYTNQNMYFMGFGDVIYDYTDPNGPLYDPATYAGDNIIRYSWKALEELQYSLIHLPLVAK